MSVPTFYPPVQPGVCDAGVVYTFELLARGASVLQSGWMVGGMGRAGGWVSNDGVCLQALDSPGGASNAPGDLAVRCQILDVETPWFDADRTISVDFEATDNTGVSVEVTQSFVVRKWTAAGTYSPGSGVVSGGAALSFGTVASTSAGTVTFGLASHGFSVGDRLWLGLAENPLWNGAGGTAVIGNYFWSVTAVVDSGHFTAASMGGVFGGGVVNLSADSSGHQFNLVYLDAYQKGRTQNDITSAAVVSGTRGVALTPFTIVTDGGATPSAMGVPDGVGLTSGVLSGTPVTYGWYPVTLIEGTMQRLCLFSIDPGSYDDLLVAASVVNVNAGNGVASVITAPSLAGTSISWYLNNAPSGVGISGNGGNTATITGIFPGAGNYAVTVVAVSSNGAIVSKTITFVVTGASQMTSASALWVPWLHSDLSLLDLQFDLRGRSVQSYYAANGVISLIESDGCKLAILLLTPEPASDATTLWLTARRDVDGRPVIDQQVSGSSALTAVSGGSYYLMTLDLSADAVLDALNDLDEPNDGSAPVLTLQAQVAVLRGGQTARSRVFALAISQRIADAGSRALNVY